MAEPEAREIIAGECRSYREMIMETGGREEHLSETLSRHIDACPECRAFWEDFRTMRDITMTSPDAAPPTDLAERVVGALKQREKKQGTVGRTRKLLGILSAVVAAECLMVLTLARPSILRMTARAAVVASGWGIASWKAIRAFGNSTWRGWYQFGADVAHMIGPGTSRTVFSGHMMWLILGSAALAVVTGAFLTAVRMPRHG